MAAKKIGRFNILRELGKGTQGTVHLAHDPQLDRQVAIKTLRPGSTHGEDLQREARIVSRLQHANIVPLYDAGMHGGEPYLVCAYIEGGTLQRMLKDGAMSPVKAAQIACNLLDALECAHQQGVLHLDIKPGNIMIGQRGQPMLMDFGIARLMKGGSEDRQEVVGTPQYMAPESITSSGVDASTDLYAVGMVLYEMVTGVPAFTGDNAFAVMNRVVTEAAVPPSKHVSGINDGLESIIMKSIAKRKDERYVDAAAMRAALGHYLGSVDEAVIHDTHGTLDFLLRRMRNKSDFPALSSSISEINQIVASDSGSANKLARAILQDFALTNKLLRLVNSVSYGRFSGNISTISKAVVIMGFETVRNIAMSLIMLEFMQNRSMAQQIRDEVVAAYFSGVLAMLLAEGQDMHDVEELMICSMFQNLGRALVIYYFFEESQEILRLVEQGASEDQAAIKVLGLNCNQIGIGVARAWNFPKRLLDGMKRLPDGEPVKKGNSDLEQLLVVANMANDLCRVATCTALHRKTPSLQWLRLRYKDALDISEHKLNALLETGLQELSRRAMVLEINTARSPLMGKARQWSGKPINSLPRGTVRESRASDVPGIEALLKEEGVAQNRSGPTPEDLLGAGIHDVTNTLVEEHKLNDILLMVLETIYRGLGFRHAIICIRDNKLNAMVARMGLGAGVEEIIPRFHFTMSCGEDVFCAAIDKGDDIVVEDVGAGSIAHRIPGWYRQAVDSEWFILLPVVVNKKVVGLFYADMQKANSLKLTAQQLSLLRTLRNQAVLAIKQKM